MLQVRKASQRGLTKIQWLESYHSFSFGSYFDPNHMGFGQLRVINDDRVQPGSGFGTHPHRDMEIISYVVEGQMEHKDSTGVAGVISTGDIQVMTAGKGIFHSEYNHSLENPVRFLQIWITPEQRGLEPGYQQKNFAHESMDQLQLLVSPDGAKGSLKIHADAHIYRAKLKYEKPINVALNPNSKYWIQVVCGELEIKGAHFTEGDGVALYNETNLTLNTQENAEILLFQLNDV